jgi:hypothetical protein
MVAFQGTNKPNQQGSGGTSGWANFWNVDVDLRDLARAVRPLWVPIMKGVEILWEALRRWWRCASNREHSARVMSRVWRVGSVAQASRQLSWNAPAVLQCHRKLNHANACAGS